MAEKLAAYEAKRNFQKTAEPRGDAGVRATDKLRFVVQRHDATRLHYDLRLELGGVFKSWAVTKGPSLNPDDKRLAVEVEDHPLGYGDFEGTIPKGQYGGGTVQLFDRGTWAPEGKIPPDRALKDGELKFVLHGARLKGSFVLVRLKRDRSGGKRTNWLLIKHRDEAANDQEDGGGLLAIETSVASGRTLAQIAAGKGRAPRPFMLDATQGPRADAIWDSSEGQAAAARAKPPDGGHPASSPKSKLAAALHAAPAKAATPGTIGKPMPDFVPPQLCRSVAKPPSGTRWLHEIKFDGYRLQMRIEGGTAALRTRTGLDWTEQFAALARTAARLPEALLDGEVVALDAAGKPSFPALQVALAEGKTDALVYFAFDLLFLDGRDLRKTPLLERKDALEQLLQKTRCGKTVRFAEHFTNDGREIFDSARALGLEGIVSKQTKAAYRSGRSESWTKAKCRIGHEIVIGAWTETNGQFRSLLGGVFRGGRLTYVGRIGTGYGAATVAKLMPKLTAHARKTSPFDAKGAPPRAKDIRWVDPVLVAEIEFADWSTDGLVRQAAFKGLREDKRAADVEAELPMSPPKTMPTPAPVPSAKPRKTASKAKPSVMGVVLSNADKALWPEDGDGEPVTKQDLALYLEAVGDWMLPHIAGRPCSIVRAPDGIDGQTFFQRHAMPGGSDLFDTIMIEGDREPYLIINHVEVLAAVAQSGGLELHPSNCAKGRPDVPGRLVFDLDPAPDVGFDTVVAAAKDMRARLAAVGLAAFCKTTGGKGLHVVTPLAVPQKPVTWDVAKRFARDLCVMMERDAPKTYLTKASKAARAGRIYLDYLRNDLLATAVAPLSPRARPYAHVSMPLTWAQVKVGLDPGRFTIRTTPALLERSKAWRDYDGAAESIEDAIARLRRV